MQFERVGTVSVGCFFFKVFWEIDDLNSLERAFLLFVVVFELMETLSTLFFFQRERD